MMKINEFLKEKREEQGLKQNFVAEKLELKTGAVLSTFETGKVRWDFDRVEKYLNFLGYKIIIEKIEK